MPIRKITTKDATIERVETGSLQINDDWPGYFIRGDEALMISASIEAALLGLKKYPETFTLRMTKSMLESLADGLKQTNLSDERNKTSNQTAIPDTEKS